MINLDPKLVDQETIRKQKRKRMLQLAAVPIAILALLFVLSVRQVIYNVLYRISVDNGAGLANAVTQMQLFSNYAEPYIAHYNEGILRLKNGEYARAEQSFNSAINNNPPVERQCAVYNNLAISIEMQADEYVKSYTYDTAIEYYLRAKSILTSNGCASDSENADATDEKSQESNERIAKKQTSAVAAKNKITESSESSQSDTPAPSQEELEKIKQMQSNSYSELNKLRNGIGNSSSNGGGGYYTNPTPW